MTGARRPCKVCRRAGVPPPRSSPARPPAGAPRPPGPAPAIRRRDRLARDAPTSRLRPRPACAPPHAGRPPSTFDPCPCAPSWPARPDGVRTTRPPNPEGEAVVAVDQRRRGVRHQPARAWPRLDESGRFSQARIMRTGWVSPYRWTGYGREKGARAQGCRYPSYCDGAGGGRARVCAGLARGRPEAWHGQIHGLRTIRHARHAERHAVLGSSVSRI